MERSNRQLLSIPPTHGPYTWTPPFASHGTPLLGSGLSLLFLRGKILGRADGRFENQDFSDLAQGPPAGVAGDAPWPGSTGPQS